MCSFRTVTQIKLYSELSDKKNFLISFLMYFVLLHIKMIFKLKNKNIWLTYINRNKNILNNVSDQSFLHFKRD